MTRSQKSVASGPPRVGVFGPGSHCASKFTVGRSSVAHDYREARPQIYEIYENVFVCFIFVGLCFGKSG